MLLEASNHHGIEPGYRDNHGVWHETTDELRGAILNALGVDPDVNPAPQRWLAPVHVLLASDPVLQLASATSGHAELLITFEDGAATRVSGDVVAAQIRLPDGLPPGYHTAAVTLNGETATTQLILCPDRCRLPSRRCAGLAVSLYGVHSNQTWGCGDFTALKLLMDWAAHHIGADYIAVNPLQAIHNRAPFNTSPYLPNSLHYRNFIYLDIDAIPDLAHSESARVLRHHRETLEEIRALNEAEFVAYERVAALKLRFLRLAFDTFLRHERDTPRGLAFRAWCDAEGGLLAGYAAYSALDEYLHAQNPNLWIWPHWPEPYQNPRSPEVTRFVETHSEAVLFHNYVQWVIDGQLRALQEHARACGMEIGLLHDLPLATDRCGAELWAHRDFYVSGCRVGAPPDAFAPKGQDWSFPPPNRDAHRAAGYRLFAESIRHAARHGGALRIDHVMRLFRLYWIPDGYDATTGAYVRDYAQDLLRVLALESHRQRLLIVGEDLGTVDPDMRESLERHGILSYRLFYFEKGEYPSQALVSSTTHDLPTLAGFWAHRDIDLRHALNLLSAEDAARWHNERRADKRWMLEMLRDKGFLPPDYPLEAADGSDLVGDIHNAITGFLASTPCLLMTLNQEDLTKELDQQNLPSTTWQYPNWQRKMKFSMEQLQVDPLAVAFARMFHGWLEKTGRLA